MIDIEKATEDRPCLDWPCGCWIESSGESGACGVHKSNFMWCDRLAELAARYRQPEVIEIYSESMDSETANLILRF